MCGVAGYSGDRCRYAGLAMRSIETKALNYSVLTVSSQGECHIIEAMSWWVTLLRLGRHGDGRGWA